MCRARKELSMKNEEENKQELFQDDYDKLVNSILEVFFRPFLEKEIFEKQGNIERKEQ